MVRMRRLWLLCLLVSLAACHPAATGATAAPRARHVIASERFAVIADELSGERARETLRAIADHHRIQGSPMMAAVAERVVLASLQASRIESSIEQMPSDSATKYGTWISPMGWTMRGGELWIDPPSGSKEPATRLCNYADVPMCVATYSRGGEWAGELIDVGEGTHDADYAGKDVRGKVALASGYAADVVRAAVIERGAVGAVIRPAADDRPSHPDMIRYNGIWPRASELATTRAAFMVSANQYAALKERMRGGAVIARGRVDADLAPYELTLVHAYLRGRERPDQEVLVTAHLDHPKWSANDNASGSAAILEIARALSAAIDAGKLPAPKRTIHFLWVPEFFGTEAYVWKHPEARRCGAWDDPRPAPAQTTCIVADVNLDMVGEDTVKTGSHFYFTRAPDSVPSFLTPLLADVLEQTREADLVAPTGTRNPWKPEIVRHLPGSDHDVFLGLGVPSTMLGHDPDWTHHTSEDTVDKTDATELRRVGVFAAAAVHWIATADDRALGLPAEAPAPSDAHGPRRLTTLPFEGSAFEDLAGADLAWCSAQKRAFGERAGTTFDDVVYETVSFMDGHRGAAEIARRLSAEFAKPIDAAWVQRVVAILAAHGLVAP